ncbi:MULTISPECIES: hypothetical protein [unclassified Bradyrhizobium]|uniref:hypothetical protein n=1 Tax=unclassified Bradyrhizobium TaxID=2631580 RepID=UPI00048A9FA5|nr:MULTISPECIES: hypothetical protein [unclassified Bradyrhizobium]QIG91246.1 hypothetical protein G6P99_01085 [Bradyrhizobium sp. 6(2017)]
MTSGQDTNSTAQAESLESSKDGAQNTAPQTSPTSDALSDSSLDKVAGGGWPYATMGSAQVTPTI